MRKGQIRKPHKSDCQCLPCKNRRGEPHKLNCQCATCKAKRGETCGVNNSNFGNRWTEAQKIDQSKISKKRMEDPNMRFRCGVANRGKTFSDQRKQNIADGHRGLKWGNHSEKSKRIIGIKSSKKFKDENFRKKYRKTMEERGYWLSLDQVEPYLLYCRKADWKGNVFKYLSEKELLLLNKKGLFSSKKGMKKNTNGLVRDHRYSRYSGFKNKIFPIILRHPANCQLITNSENISKAKKGHRYKDGDSITLEKLFYLIRKYKKNWQEQQKCLGAIDKYQNNKRYLIKGGDANVC